MRQYFVFVTSSIRGINTTYFCSAPFEFEKDGIVFDLTGEHIWFTLMGAMNPLIFCESITEPTYDLLKFQIPQAELYWIENNQPLNANHLMEG